MSKPMDLEADKRKQMEDEEGVEQRDRVEASVAMAARSPSPSALSTASSGSPLIRNNSTTSSHSGSQQQARRPAPTSIAAAQLQQQLGKAAALGQPNKLAHMTRGQLDQAVNYRLQAAGQPGAKSTKKANKAALDAQASPAASPPGHNARGLAYELAKKLARKANRFNDFWSVNKMRYLNLACLLMTLVCLLTILLFSKSNVGQQQPGQPEQARWSSAKFGASQAATRRPLDAHTSQPDREAALEALETLDRQPLVASSSARRRSTVHLEGAHSNSLEDGASKEEAVEKPQDFFDQMLADARRQLKRQQEVEREAEESATSASATSTTTASSPAGPANSKEDSKRGPANSPLEPNLSQLFDDLDNFGLFKSIKSQLLGANLSQTRPTIVRKSPHGATIMMSFGPSQAINQSSGPNSNSSSSSSSSSSSNSNSSTMAMSSLFEKLLPPIFRPVGSLLPDDNPARARANPTGFATITIRSEPLVRAGGAFMPAGLSPFPQSPFAGVRPAGSLVNPFIVSSNQMAPPIGGLFNAILRATSDLVAADQLQQQLDSVSANETQTNASNSTSSSSSSGGGNTKEALSQQASHKATITRLLPSTSGPESTGSGNSTENPDDEVETFDLGQLIDSRLSSAPSSPSSAFPFMRSPFAPLFRSLHQMGPSKRRAGSLIISSRSSPIDSNFDSSPLGGAEFGADSAPSPFGFLPPVPLAASLMMPQMIMLSSSPSPSAGVQSGAPGVLRALVAASKQLEQREKESSSNAARGEEHEQESGESDSWDEHELGGGAGGKLMPRHRSASDSQEDESLDQAPFLSSVSSGASSLIEHMLESSNGAAPVARLSGTIKQVFRGPGMTVERIIELPTTGNTQQVRHHFRPPLGERHSEVQAVPAEVRSQSISRMDELDSSNNEPHKTAGSQRVATFVAGLSPEPRSDSASELERSFARHASSSSPLAAMSRGPPVGGLISRLFSDMSRQYEPDELLESPLAGLHHPLGSFLKGANSLFAGPSSSFKSQRQQRAFSERSMDDDSDNESPEQDEQQDSEPSQPVWSPKIRLGSARLRLSPAGLHAASMPARFSMAAEPTTGRELDQMESSSEPQDNSRLQRAMRSAPIRSINEHQEQPDQKPASAFTSPNSALFGFPALKVASKALPDKMQARATDPSSRPFVYHSNHELAGSMGRSGEPKQPELAQAQLGESRSSYQHRSTGGAHSVAGVPAAIGMGRRLDEGELLS